MTDEELEEIEARARLARERFCTNPPRFSPEAIDQSLGVDLPRLVAEVRRLREALRKRVYMCTCPGAEIDDRKYDCRRCREDRDLLS